MLKSFLYKLNLSLSKFPFSTLSRSEKIQRNAPKDLTKIHTNEEQIKEDHKRFISENENQKYRPLSEAPFDRNPKKFGLKFVEDKTKLNKVLRENYKEVLKSTSSEKSDMFEEFNDEHQTANLSENKRENLRKIEEMKQFNKVFFKKNEVIRLLRKQELLAENFLPIDSLQNDVFMLDLRKRFHDYKSNLNSLRNNRIDNFLFHSNENQKLALLLQSGLLDSEKNIKEIIHKSVELIQQNKQIDTVNNSTYNEITLIGQNMIADFKNDKELYFSMIKGMGFELDQNLTQYDFEKLALFFESIIKVNPQTTQKLMENLHLIQKIKTFEEFLFEHFLNNSLDIRVKGRAEFKNLTERESLNYVKYNIEKIEDLFLMFDNSKQIQSPALVSTMLQKVSLLHFKRDESILYVINDKRYGAFLRYITNSIDILSNKDFVNTVWALGNIHKKEKGIIHKRIFKVMIPRISNEILKRMNDFTVEEFSFLCRGLITLPFFKLSNNAEYANQIFSYIEEKIDKVNNLFVFQGFNLLLSVNPCEKSLELLQKSFYILSENQNFINSLDEHDIMDICFFYSTFLNKPPENSSFLPKIKKFFVDNSIIVLKYIENFTIDDISSLLIFFTKLNINEREMTLNLRRKMLDSIKDYQRLRDFSLAKATISFAYQDYLEKNQQFKFNIDSFFESMLLINLFPGELHKPMSAKYIPYSEIAKIIDMSKHKIKEKWLCSTLFTLASVNFKNEEFFESIIQYLLDEKPTENLEIISYLTIIAYMLDLSFFSKNNLKEKMYAKIKNSKDYIKNPTLSFRLIYIANTIYKDLPIDKKWLMESQYFDYFSNEFLILLAWSFTNYHKENNNDINKEIEEFRKELNLCLDMRVDIETLRKNPYLLYCYNQILQLANAGLSNKLEEKTNIFQEFYKIIDTKVEEIEFYQGKRFSTQSLKEGVFNFLLEENLVNKKEFFTKSNIKLDFLLNVENKAINVYDDEHFITDLEGKRILKPIFQNEMEILKKEGFKVLIISSSEYLNVGVEYKGIESEKKAKKIFLKKILKTFI